MAFCDNRVAKSFAAAVLLGACLGTPAHAERVALVIGNSAYKNVTPLDNPRNDAKLMAETLRSLGFTLVGGGAQLDLDKAALEQAIQSFSNQIQGADVDLFYYAGHGVQARGSNYLVPVSANPTRESDLDFQMIDVNLVLRQMEGAGTRLNIVILDACRNNPFGGRSLRAIGSGLAQMQAPEGTLIGFATQPGNVAKDGENGNSPYTKALVETIQKPGLGIFDAFNEVGLDVKQATGGTQQPWLSSSPIAGSFYFAGLPTARATAPSAAQTAPAAQPNEAQQVWGTIQNTTSIAVLDSFIAQFGGTIYGELARARLEELKKGQVAVVSPPAAAPPRAAEFSQWLTSARYQELFNEMVQQHRYPRAVEAEIVNNTLMFRAAFSPYPSGKFSFYSHHGLTAESFAQKDETYRSQGFALAYRQSVKNGDREFVQGVWIRR